jgi:hypothetical protein
LSEVPHAKGRHLVLNIKNHDGTVYDTAVMKAILVPLPSKIRLSPTRMRELGFSVAQALGDTPMPGLSGKLVVSCRYELSVDFLRRTSSLGVSAQAAYRLLCETALSRYIGVVAVSGPEGPMIDILVDATETEANPFVLAFIQRCTLPPGPQRWAEQIAQALGVGLLH